MLPDRVSNPGPLTYESGVLPIALRGPAFYHLMEIAVNSIQTVKTLIRLRVMRGGGRVVRWCWVNFHCRGVLQL